MIKTKLTKRAQRWLNNYCEQSTLTIQVDETVYNEKYVPKRVSNVESILKINSKGEPREIPLKLNVYKMKDSDVTIKEFIQGYKFQNNNIVVYTGLRFQNEKEQKVICSLWGYKPDYVNQQELVNN